MSCYRPRTGAAGAQSPSGAAPLARTWSRGALECAACGSALACAACAAAERAAAADVGSQTTEAWVAPASPQRERSIEEGLKDASRRKVAFPAEDEDEDAQEAFDGHDEQEAEADPADHLLQHGGLAAIASMGACNKKRTNKRDS